jgi:hypothetical protein
METGRGSAKAVAAGGDARRRVSGFLRKGHHQDARHPGSTAVSCGSSPDTGDHDTVVTALVTVKELLRGPAAPWAFPSADLFPFLAGTPGRRSANPPAASARVRLIALRLYERAAARLGMGDRGSARGFLEEAARTCVPRMPRFCRAIEEVLAAVER